MTDLTADDFEVLEDNAPQQVTSFELVRARGVVPDSARVEPNTVAESRERAARPDARVFVLFLDTLHVQVEGSYRAQYAGGALLDRVIGAGRSGRRDDARDVGPQHHLLAADRADRRRCSPTNWAWGERGSRSPSDPRENDSEACVIRTSTAPPASPRR